MKDEELEPELERLGDGGGPPAGWQEKVLAQVDRPAPPVQSTPWPIALAGTGLVVAAVVTLLVVGLRGPEARRSTGPAAVDPQPADADRKQEVVDRLDDRLDVAVERLLEARTGAERAEAQRLLRETTEKVEALERGLEKARLLERGLEKARVKWPKLDDGKITAKCDPNDPLCGVE